jgi:hypothetical protein
MVERGSGLRVALGLASLSRDHRRIGLGRFLLTARQVQHSATLQSSIRLPLVLALGTSRAGPGMKVEAPAESGKSIAAP